MRKATLSMVLVLVLAGVVAPAGEAQRRNVSFVLKNLINPFCVTVQEGAVQAAKDYNLNLTMLTPLQGDNIEELVQLTEQVVASGECDAFVVYPSDSLGMIPAVESVREAGIPVILTNTIIWSDEPLWETFVECDNVPLGRKLGEALAKKMNYKGKVVLIDGVPGTQPNADRMGGARESIEKYPDMQIIAQQPANLNRAMAMEVMQNLLQAHPDIDGLFAMNDEMALGCIEAIDAAGRLGQIVVAGCDANKDARRAVREGRLALTCDVSPFYQGYRSVEAAAMILDGKTPPANIKVETTIVDETNIADYP